jgi:hypothetical protein
MSLDMVTAADVRAALEQTLRSWLPWTLAEVCEHAGRDRDHLAAPADDAYYELHDIDQLDKIAPQTVRVATVVPDVAFVGAGRDQQARWDTIVNLVCKGADHGDTVRRSDLYRAAIRIVLHQHQDLGGLASSTEVTRAGYRPLASSSRLLLANTVHATVTTDHATPLHGAPDVPPGDPFEVIPDPPPATEVVITVEPEEA